MYNSDYHRLFRAQQKRDAKQVRVGLVVLGLFMVLLLVVAAVAA